MSEKEITLDLDNQTYEVEKIKKRIRKHICILVDMIVQMKKKEKKRTQHFLNRRFGMHTHTYTPIYGTIIDEIVSRINFQQFTFSLLSFGVLMTASTKVSLGPLLFLDCFIPIGSTHALRSSTCTLKFPLGGIFGFDNDWYAFIRFSTFSNKHLKFARFKKTLRNYTFCILCKCKKNEIALPLLFFVA